MIAAIDAPTAAVVTGIISAFGLLAARWAPKTRTEAAVERSQVNVNDAQRWHELVEAQEQTLTRYSDTIDRLEAKVDALERTLAQEREECDRQVADLSEQVIRLRRDMPETPPPRLFFRE